MWIGFFESFLIYLNKAVYRGQYLSLFKCNAKAGREGSWERAFAAWLWTIRIWQSLSLIVYNLPTSESVSATEIMIKNSFFKSFFMQIYEILLTHHIFPHFSPQVIPLTVLEGLMGHLFLSTTTRSPISTLANNVTYCHLTLLIIEGGLLMKRTLYSIIFFVLSFLALIALCGHV